MSSLSTAKDQRSSCNVEIRPITVNDFDVWLPLFKGYQIFYKSDIAPDVEKVTFERFLDANEPVYGAIAWKNDRAVGIVHYLMHRSTWAIGDYCYINDLYVSEEARCGGVGRALMDYAIDDARSKNCARVHWTTHETNTTAQHLYDQIVDRSGFISYRMKL